jgi:hypothetical protein
MKDVQFSSTGSKVLLHQLLGDVLAAEIAYVGTAAVSGETANKYDIAPSSPQAGFLVRPAVQGNLRLSSEAGSIPAFRFGLLGLGVQSGTIWSWHSVVSPACATSTLMGWIINAF